MDRLAAEKALVKLARQSARTWANARGDAFEGVISFETANTVYRFIDGLFSMKAARAPGAPRWESPASMKGVELVGFLADEGDFWSLSPRWRAGALAVITTANGTLTLTSVTISCNAQRSRPIVPPPHRLPHTRAPEPGSLTRLQQAPVRQSA